MPIESALDLMVTLFFAPGFTKREAEPIRDTTRLVKLLFLLVREGGFKEYERQFEFEPYDFGPWSGEVFDKIETLNQIGILRITESRKEYVDKGAVDDEELARQIPELRIPPSNKIRIYSLTEKGQKIGKKLYDSLSQSERGKIEELKSRFNNVPLLKLLEYVYTKYPDAITKSKIRAKVLVRSMFGVSPDLPKFKREEEDFRDVH